MKNSGIIMSDELNPASCQTGVKPKPGECPAILNLLLHLCGGNHDVYRYALKWLAYPLQNPGAKMQTAMVINGPQGCGKSLMSNAMLAIYGGHGCVIGADLAESKFNGYLSGKMFIVLGGTVALSGRYQVKNLLKVLMIGESIVINAKNKPAVEVKNGCNLLFTGNHGLPTALEDDDQHFVVHAGQPKSADFYQAVADEIAADGAAALYDYLLNLDLGGFNEHTKPPLIG